MHTPVCLKPQQCPFSSHLLVDTNNTTDLQSAINLHMEARNIRTTQTSKIPHYQVNRVGFQEVQVLGINHSNALSVTSEKFTSAHMVMPLTGGVSQRDASGRWDIAPGEGLVISPGQEMDMYWEPDTIAMTMRIPESTVQRYLVDYFDIPLYDTIRFDGKFNWVNTESHALREMLSGICKELQNPHSLFSRGITTRAIEEQLILTFIDALPSNYSTALKLGHKNHRPRHVKLAMDYVIAHSQREILAKDLVQASGVSLRTLQNGFKGHCAVSPTVWVRNYKLSCVRNALLNMNYDELSIGDVAALWGFYHSSNFSRNYLALFGEHPSVTRRNKRH